MSSETRQKPAACLTVDIGGTNWRVGPAQGPSVDPESSYEAPWSGEHDKSLEKLKGSLEEVLRGWRGNAVTVAVAGPVNDGIATMTNWPKQPRIFAEAVTGEPFSAVIPEDKPDELALTFPAKHVAIENDLVAAVYGLVGALDERSLGRPECRTLLEPQRPFSGKPGESGPESRLVLIMPGTGLGTAALVRTMDEAGGAMFAAVPSEMQHAEIPPLDEAHARLIERWKGATGLTRLRWEDFVSGDGLVRTYHLLGGVDDLDAGAIADRACEETDRASVEALEVYYCCVARYAQLAALAYQPTHGIFLGGDTTRGNQEFLCARRRAFRWGFYDIESRVHLEKLEDVPIDLVLGELVLRGGRWIAQRALRRLGVSS